MRTIIIQYTEMTCDMYDEVTTTSPIPVKPHEI